MRKSDSIALMALMAAVGSAANPLPFTQKDERRQPEAERSEKLDKAVKKRLKRMERNRKLAQQEQTP